MSDDKPVLSLNGATYPFVGPSEFSLGELCDCEQHFDASFNDEEINARKLAAILFISMRRVDPRVQPANVRDLSAEDLERINDELTRWQAASGDALPPALSESDDVESTSSTPSSNGASDTPSEFDLSSTGDLTSDTGSAFAPLTSGN